mmetsp:Transcript_34516/g.75543  ORF Transcript_34516/g.75543 Transcript_34516/m.75543 type:complete len:214 (-) Transcript_34516:100-741(-)
MTFVKKSKTRPQVQKLSVVSLRRSRLLNLICHRGQHLSSDWTITSRIKLRLQRSHGLHQLSALCLQSSNLCAQLSKICSVGLGFPGRAGDRFVITTRRGLGSSDPSSGGQHLCHEALCRTSGSITCSYQSCAFCLQLFASALLPNPWGPAHCCLSQLGPDAPAALGHPTNLIIDLRRHRHLVARAARMPNLILKLCTSLLELLTLLPQPSSDR